MTEVRKKMFKDHNPYTAFRSDKDFEKLTGKELTDELDFEKLTGKELTDQLRDLGKHKPIFTEYSTTMLKELSKKLYLVKIFI